MTTFTYKAKKQNAQTVSGEIKASSKEEAIEFIQQLGLYPITVRSATTVKSNNDLQEESRSSKTSSSKTFKKSSISIKDLYWFSRQLSNLLRSGMQIIKALSILQKQTKNSYLRDVITDICQNVKNGKSLSGSLSKYPHVFSFLFVTMVHAGEEGGLLHEMLAHIAVYQKKQAAIIQKVRMAFIYPLIMLTMGIGTVIFILTFVFPKMKALFDSLQDTMPLPTQILLFLSDICQSFWWIIFPGLLLMGFGLWRWSQTVSGKKFLSVQVLKIPIVGSMLLKVEMTKFTRTLSLLMNNGINVIRSVDIAIPVMSNEHIKEQLKGIRERIITGQGLGHALSKVPVIPEVMVHMIIVGEESGHLESILGEIADIYEQESDEMIKSMTTLLEPLLILSIGGVIGFMVFAMLMPLFQMDILAF